MSMEFENAIAILTNLLNQGKKVAIPADTYFKWVDEHNYTGMYIILPGSGQYRVDILSNGYDLTAKEYVADGRELVFIAQVSRRGGDKTKMVSTGATLDDIVVCGLGVNTVGCCRCSYHNICAQKVCAKEVP